MTALPAFDFSTTSGVVAFHAPRNRQERRGLLRRAAVERAARGARTVRTELALVEELEATGAIDLEVELARFTNEMETWAETSLATSGELWND